MQHTVNPHATPAAKALLHNLCETAGHAIITGQHTQTNPMEEIAYIRSVTGKEPLLRGFELLSYSPNICYTDASEACLTEIYENRGTLETALRWAMQSKGILTFTFHWFSPLGGHDKSFYSKNTDFDPTRILLTDSAERRAFYRDLDVIAALLKPFLQNDIPILWRPFHEADGTWFWWGSRGPEIACRLYQMMYDRFTDKHHLDNLLWVWNCPLRTAYPRDAYVDVISTDIYLPAYEATDYADAYHALIQNTTSRKVAALGEVGYLPDIRLLAQSRVPWAYYMTWSKEFCIGEQYNRTAALRDLYESPYARTLPD